jgi:hypothetical protein
MFPVVINVAEALNKASEIEASLVRDSTVALIMATEQFFKEQPSQLMASFDLAFFAEVFRSRFPEIRAIWRAEYHDAFDDWRNEKSTEPVLDPRTDIWEYGVRPRQAHNYAVVHYCERTRGVLQALATAARWRQMPNVRSRAGLPVLRPESPVDFLFLVMAADYALRPGQELARLLSSGESALTGHPGTGHVTA